MVMRVLLCWVVLTLGAVSGAQSFTLEQVMSGTFNSLLVAAPAGERVGWVANAQGRRNVWVAETGGGAATARALTAYMDDDGQDIGDLAWMPDGESLLFVCGGDFEFPGRPDPNPAQAAGGVEQAIWLVGRGGGMPRKLATGRSPQPAPDGKTLLFLNKDAIWSMGLEDGARPAKLLEMRGTPGVPQWSPDGKYVAFTSGRGDHGFVGVYAVAEKTLRYLAPSTQTDRYPEWSPDSRQIAFVRLPEGSGGGVGARRAGEPWSIWVADAATGAGRQVWTAGKGAGSVFHALATERQIFWMKDGRLVFPWEGDGWEHLYAAAVGGKGAAVRLTPGEFEVEHAAMSAGRERLVFSSNQGDIDRRHVWQLDGGGGPKQLTRGDGSEVFPALTAGGRVAVLRADARVPIRPALVDAAGGLADLAPALTPSGYPAAKLVVPQAVTVMAADGMALHGQLFLPAGSGRHKALVFFHGGSRRQMLLGYHYMDYYSNAYAMNQYLASRGYVVLSVNYRSGIGYGLNFREALNYGATGASEYNDVQGAGLYLRARADVDPQCIGVWGGSYGGYLTALALARASDMFAAGVDFHGVHDWSARLRGAPDGAPASGEPAPDPAVARLAFESSPLAAVKTWRSPVLLIQGDDDRNVAFSQTVRMAAALRAQGVPFEEYVFPDEIHGFLRHASWVKAYGLTADFFARKLAPAP